jgi:5-methylcytosine-specific restriction protein B
MNTADRSIEALDTALRRRFTFEELPPKPYIITTEGKLKSSEGELKVGNTSFTIHGLLNTMNSRIEKLIDKDHMIGHSYFMGVDSIPKLQEVFHRNVIPLLEEYFYGDKGKIQLVLGRGFIEQVNHSGEQSAFAESDYDDSIFDDREVWKLKKTWIHDESEFETALNLMMK